MGRYALPDPGLWWQSVHMPVSYSFDDRFIHLRMAGEYTTADLRRTLQDALADRQCGQRDGVLFDLSESKSLHQRTPTDIQEMARFLASQSEPFGGRLAMVAPSDLAYGLMRIGVVIAEASGAEPRVFRTTEEALEWLRGQAAG
jgi:hypothetical protein